MKPLSQLLEPNFLHLRLLDQSFHIYIEIRHSTGYLASDDHIFMFLVRTSAQLLVHGTVLSIHVVVVKYGFEHNPHGQSGSIYTYAGLGGLAACHQTFSSIGEPDLVCQTAMVNACVKTGDFAFAWNLFNKMPHKDLIAWNVMISGYAQCGQSRKALSLFDLMERQGVILGG